MDTGSAAGRTGTDAGAGCGGGDGSAATAGDATDTGVGGGGNGGVATIGDGSAACLIGGGDVPSAGSSSGITSAAGCPTEADGNIDGASTTGAVISGAVGAEASDTWG